AGGAKWGQGFTYLWDFAGPYHLYIPVLVLLVAGVFAARARRTSGERQRWTVRRFREWLRSPGAVVAMVLGAGLLLTVYALRVGGDFMHGRMLLPQLFLLLLPVAVIPIRLPERGRPIDWVTAGLLVAWIGTLGWALFAASTTAIKTGTVIRSSGIVD
ncbi:hypothetical protein ACFWFG_38665, partial [Streptomyces roseolus]